MNHPSEEELVLHYYGEPDALPGVESHLSDCELCRAEYHRIQRVLNSVDGLPVPERGADYEELVWRRISPALAGAKHIGPRFAFREWLPWAVTATLLMGAFLAGRLWQSVPPPHQAELNPERLLMVAVGDHLERTKLVLVELSNAQPGDISFEQSTAQELVEANRLFRQTAATEGDGNTAEILDELERVLLEIARQPATISPAQLNELQQEIQDRQILPKVKTFEARLKEDGIQQEQEKDTL